MLTPEEKQWCLEMLYEIRIKKGAQIIAFSNMLHLAFTLDLN